uniref:Uncharacterized protein n=1 Tax=Anguilla anguilla TaxID=7936 RepID=A0A0E9UDF5_ANGAN
MCNASVITACIHCSKQHLHVYRTGHVFNGLMFFCLIV